MSSPVYLGAVPTPPPIQKPRSETRIPTVSGDPTMHLSPNFSEKAIPSLRRDVPGSHQPGPIVNYKTKPCRHYESGKCKLSGLCNFAHGLEELQAYQRAARGDDKSLRTIDTLSHGRPETSLQKIEKMEAFLEHFYLRQRALLEQLKVLSGGIKPGCPHNEESISQMEGSILAVYNSAVNYAQEIGRTMDLGKRQGKGTEAGSLEEVREPTAPPKSEQFMEAIQEWDERQLEIVRKQIWFILDSLKGLHAKASDQAKVLGQAEAALCNSQMLEASRLLQQVLYDKSLDPATQAAHRKVFDRAMSLNFN